MKLRGDNVTSINISRLLTGSPVIEYISFNNVDAQEAVVLEVPLA